MKKGIVTVLKFIKDYAQIFWLILAIIFLAQLSCIRKEIRRTAHHKKARPAAVRINEDGFGFENDKPNFKRLRHDFKGERAKIN
jgi:hypothetical protein